MKLRSDFVMKWNKMKSDLKLSSKSMFYYRAIQVNGNLFDCKSGNFISNL